MDEDNIFTTGELAYFNDKATFFAGIDGDVTGNVTGDLEGNIFAPGLCIFENGPVIIGGLEDTDTPGQVLQIYGGGYFEGALGIGTTNVAGIGSTSTLFGVFGDTTVTGYQYRGSRIKTASLTVRGGGLNQSNGNDRFVALNGEILYDGSGRGLALTIIGVGLTHVSTTPYDIFGSSVDSDNLAAAISGISTGQIGVLSSADAWELNITDNLRIAARRVGLSKLGNFYFPGGGDYRRPYAAVFYGVGSNPNSSPHDVIERMESTDSNAPYASIFCTLMSDEVGVSIHGATSTNVLYSANSNIEEPVLLVDSKNNVGIGTSIPRSKLDVIGGVSISGNVGLGSAIPNTKLDVIGNSYISGSLGIGTTNPQSNLDVYGGGSFTGIVTSKGFYGTVSVGSSLELLRGDMANNDSFRILIGGQTSDNGYVEIATADNGNEPIYVSQYTYNASPPYESFYTVNRTASLLDASGNTSFPGTLSFNSGYGSAAVAYGCRAWVNFNGSGTIGVNQTINGSGNVTSVSKSNTGVFTVNFTTNMPDANYATVASGNDTLTSTQGWSLGIRSPAVGSVGINFSDNNADTQFSPDICCVAVFR